MRTQLIENYRIDQVVSLASADAPLIEPRALTGGIPVIVASALAADVQPGAVSLAGGLPEATAAGLQAAPQVDSFLAAIQAAGLAYPEIAVDLSDVSSGSFPNLGSGGGTFDPVATPLYAQTFQSPVGGTAVQFDGITEDAFLCSSTAHGDSGADEAVAVFVALAATDNPAAVANIISKRANGSSVGWQMRMSTAGVILAIVDDDVLAAISATTAGDKADNTPHYGALRYKPGALDGELACWHDDGSEVTAAALALGSLSNATGVRIGLGGGLNAFGAGTGLIRYFAVWVGADALALTKTTADALWAELGGT